MRGAISKKRSHQASNISRQQSKLPPLSIVDDNGKPSELIEASVKQQENPPLLQVVTDKFRYFQCL